jgi:hypothetical protein
MLRPRESRDLRLMSHTLAITPAPVLTWAHDVFGNAVATATFATMADMVVIDSVADILLNTAPWPVFDIAASAISYPFRYSDDEWTDLGALAIEQYSNQAGRLRIWARGFIRSNPTDTLSLLKDLSLGVAQRISYQSREVEGTQSPTQTLDRGWGSCRDFAVLFVEAARSLGFGARVVSGYLHNPNQDRAGSTGAGSTHAWVGSLCPERRLDHLRSDQPRRRRLQLDPRRGRTRYPASHAGVRQLHRLDRCLSGDGGGGVCHGLTTFSSYKRTLATFTSRAILPASSTMQMLVSLTDTSSPAKWFMLRFSF